MIARMSDGERMQDRPDGGDGERAQARSGGADSARVDVESAVRMRGRSEVFAPGVLAGRVALVTGGGTGLGKATAIELARCGADVVVMGRRGDVLERAVGEIHAATGRKARREAPVGGEDAGGEDADGGAGVDRGAGVADRETGVAGWIVGDVRDRGDAERVVGETIARRGRLDVLVNNAGGQYFTPAEAIVAKGWRAVWRLNVEGMLNMAEAAVAAGLGAGAALTKAPGVAADEGAIVAENGPTRDEGAIVNVTLSPHNGMPGMAHSGAARATVEALTRELAQRWADRGTAVTAVAAGHYDTEAMEKYPDTVRAGMARSIPLQRLGRPQEHAWLVVLLCSPLGRALNGSTITLDGARDNWFGPWPPPGLTGETGEVPTEARRTDVSGTAE